MYKVLIVDDEKIIRIGMRAIINWEELGFKVVDLVSDGEQALHVLENTDIDLVITDIKMPRMDGIELVKCIREKAFNCEVVMLTSYGEFELARESIRYGVHDYLLKGTLRDRELVETLEKVKSKLKVMKKEIKQDLLEHIRNEEDDCNIKKIFKHTIERQEDTIEAFAFSKSYQFLVFKYNPSKFEKEKLKEKNLKNYQIAIQNIVAEVSGKYQVTFLVLEENWCLCELPIEENANTHEQMLLKIQTHIMLYTNIKIVGVIGRKIYTSKDFINSIKSCMKVAELVFYKGYKYILREEMEQEFKVYKGKDYTIFEEPVKNAIDTGDYNKATQALEAYIQHLKAYYIPQAEIDQHFNKFTQELMLDYSVYLDKNKINQLIESYRKSTLLEEISSVLNELLDMICTGILQVKDKHYRKEIVEIMDYVEKHIGEKISLTTIATQINMNESYSSRLFKNETGMNIVNYINIRKMEKAKELLREKNMIVKDVAYALGFEEQSYFNRMFNKYFGLNPKQYKNIQIKK